MLTTMKLQVGVKVLIKNKNEQYLFLRRTKIMPGKTAPYWDIPGGRIEPDEALLMALEREVKEETGLRLTSTPQLVGAQDIFVPTADLHVVRLTYIANGTGDVVTSDEHEESQWVSLDEAKLLDLDPYLVEIWSHLSALA